MLVVGWSHARVTFFFLAEPLPVSRSSLDGLPSVIGGFLNAPEASTKSIANFGSGTKIDHFGISWLILSSLRH